MKISEIYGNKKQPISFEIFPPKGELEITGLRALVGDLRELSPDFISVTYSAGGSGDSKKTAMLASVIKNEFGIEASSHLTCINSNKAEVEDFMEELKRNNIENVLALRGDRVEGACTSDFTHAKDLIPTLKEAGFCVGAACYPEGHIECESLGGDIAHLREKQDCGADFFISQLFFDNRYFYEFMDKALAAGIKRPLVPGVMPILGKAQISRMIFMCGVSLPSVIIRLLSKYENAPEDLRKAGIEYAADQIRDLLNQGVDGIHIYTMNQPSIARRQLEYIKNGGRNLD